MRSFPAICWWALAIVFFTESVKSNSNTEVDETNHRLPNDTYPEHYNIELTTNVHLGDKAFEGEVTIDIVVVNTTSKIVLNAGPLKISKATIENPFTGESEDLSVEYELKREFLTLTRRNNEKFPPQSKWKLTIIYRGDLSDDNSNGFFITRYKGDEGIYHYLAATYFRPSYARHAFPCYDEVNKLANFTITINHSPTYTAISNMPVNAKLSSANRTVFLTTPTMATYLVAFTVSDFEYTEDKHSNFPLRVYSRPYKKNLHEKILPIISHFVKNVSDYIDVPYMLPKIDIFVIPNYEVKTMENWGLLMCNEIIFILEHIGFDLPDTYDEYTTLLDLVRTIAAQWFTNYVTFSPFSYIWLTTAIENLYALNAMDYVYPKWNVWDINDMYMYSLTLVSDHKGNRLLPPHYEYQTPLETMKSLEEESYAKSLCIMHMWNNALTDTIYRKGLHKFLQKNQYGLVGEQELFNALQSAVEEENYEIPATITEMIGPWINQESYPILTVSRNYSDGTFTIKQDSNTWYVPINYAVASNPNFSDTKVTHYLRNVSETNFTDVKISNNDWLILNKQSIGYYRVNYDMTNWNLIIKSLIENPFKISHRNRVQLLRDAFELWDAGHLDVSVLLNLYTYLKKEDNLLCWIEFARGLVRLDLLWRNFDKYEYIQFFVADLVKPIHEKLKWIFKSKRNYLHKDVRSFLEFLVHYVNINKSLEEDYNNLKNHIKENKTLTQDVLYCNVMKIADDETFESVFEMLIDKENHNFKAILIDALGCHRNQNLIKKLLRSFLDKSTNLEKRYPDAIINTCIASHINIWPCIEFLNENFEVVGTFESQLRYNSSVLEDAIILLSLQVRNESEEDQLLALVNKVKNSVYVSSSFEITVKNGINYSDKYAKKYTEFLTWVTEYREKAMQRTNSSR